MYRLTLYLADRTVGPVQEPTFLILTALAARPLHGYGIVQSVVDLSDGEVKLRPGTLYGALDRLDQQGLIAVDREEAVGGRLRRYCRRPRMRRPLPAPSPTGHPAPVTDNAPPRRSKVTGGLAALALGMWRLHRRRSAQRTAVSGVGGCGS